MVKTITVTELRRNLRLHLDEARKGESILVVSRGQVIARIAPPPASEHTVAAARTRLRGSVLRYDDPFEPMLGLDEWDVYR